MLTHSKKLLQCYLPIFPISVTGIKDVMKSVDIGIHLFTFKCFFLLGLSR